LVAEFAQDEPQPHRAKEQGRQVGPPAKGAPQHPQPPAGDHAVLGGNETEDGQAGDGEQCVAQDIEPAVEVKVEIDIWQQPSPAFFLAFARTFAFGGAFFGYCLKVDKSTRALPIFLRWLGLNISTPRARMVGYS